MTCDTDAVGIDHAEAHAFVDSGLGVDDELLEATVLGFLGITDDWEGSVVERIYGTAESQELHRLAFFVQMDYLRVRP